MSVICSNKNEQWIDMNWSILNRYKPKIIIINANGCHFNIAVTIQSIWSGTAIEANYKHIKDNRNIFSREWEGLNFFVKWTSSLLSFWNNSAVKHSLDLYLKTCPKKVSLTCKSVQSWKKFFLEFVLMGCVIRKYMFLITCDRNNIDRPIFL